MKTNAALGYRLAWTGFLIGAACWTLILLGSSLPEKTYGVIAGIPSSNISPNVMVLVPALTPFVGLWTFFIVTSLLIFCIGVYLILRAKNKNLLLFIALAPAFALIEIMAGIAGIAIYYLALIVVLIAAIFFGSL